MGWNRSPGQRLGPGIGEDSAVGVDDAGGAGPGSLLTIMGTLGVSVIVPLQSARSGEGKFFFTLMAAFAELERDILQERTLAGSAAARAQGRVGGRPTVMDADKLAADRARRAKGESPTQIATALGVSRASVYRHLGAAEQPRPDGGDEQARASVG